MPIVQSRMINLLAVATEQQDTIRAMRTAIAGIIKEIGEAQPPLGWVENNLKKVFNNAVLSDEAVRLVAVETAHYRVTQKDNERRAKNARARRYLEQVGLSSPQDVQDYLNRTSREKAPYDGQALPKHLVDLGPKDTLKAMSPPTELEEIARTKFKKEERYEVSGDYDEQISIQNPIYQRVLREREREAAIARLAQEKVETTLARRAGASTAQTPDANGASATSPEFTIPHYERARAAALAAPDVLVITDEEGTTSETPNADIMRHAGRDLGLG